ncbi:hypothetical protein DESPIG_01053 [Desulfovibrio piger ATCC 29098]|uniref:Uncharacterized protein n=1 Tax=Desulfovibrio piger ATCC 29098 TaxID=411464 RepID=B6WSD1_9BACT|nr:hypothetical protein DESPIG_01053 [Desulfovibrio piger ATCC 29098]
MSYAISAGKPSPVRGRKHDGATFLPSGHRKVPHAGGRRPSSAAHAAFHCRRTCQPYGFCL